MYDFLMSVLNSYLGVQVAHFARLYLLCVRVRVCASVRVCMSLSVCVRGFVSAGV